MELIKAAKVDDKPYKLEEVKKKMIYNFKHLYGAMESKDIHLAKDMENNKIKWNNIKQVEITDQGERIRMSVKYI